MERNVKISVPGIFVTLIVVCLALGSIRATAAQSETPTPTAISHEIGTATIIHDKTNVRSEPRIADGNVIAVLDLNDQVTVLESVGNGTWYEVRLEDGMIGYVSAGIVRFEATIAVTANPGETDQEAQAEGGEVPGVIIQHTFVPSDNNIPDVLPVMNSVDEASIDVTQVPVRKNFLRDATGKNIPFGGPFDCNTLQIDERLKKRMLAFTSTPHGPNYDMQCEVVLLTGVDVPTGKIIAYVPEIVTTERSVDGQKTTTSEQVWNRIYLIRSRDIDEAIDARGELTTPNNMYNPMDSDLSTDSEGHGQIVAYDGEIIITDGQGVPALISFMSSGGKHPDDWLKLPFAYNQNLSPQDWLTRFPASNGKIITTAIVVAATR